MSNIGYARGFNGCLKQQIFHSYRHIYCPISVQQEVLLELKGIIKVEKPDLGCLIEIDKGSFNSSFFNQIEHILDDNYPYFDIENKYKEIGYLRKFPIFSGKCNAFFSKTNIPYRKLFFSNGTKKLIYRIELTKNLTLFFSHFSLSKKVRQKQYQEIKALVKTEAGEVLIMGDFNAFQGFRELSSLLDDTNLKVINDELVPTFTFYQSKYAIDLCIASSSLIPRLNLKIIDQTFSDHSALLLTITQ
jgi:hypothetical protein